MQPKREIRNRQPETRRRTVSLDLPEDKDNNDYVDLKLLEAIERLERVQSKALNALGTMLSGG